MSLWVVDGEGFLHSSQHLNRPIAPINPSGGQYKLSNTLTLSYDKGCQATVELIDAPRVLTEEMLRNYLARFMEHIDVDDKEYA